MQFRLKRLFSCQSVCVCVYVFVLRLSKQSILTFKNSPQTFLTQYHLVNPMCIHKKLKNSILL